MPLSAAPSSSSASYRSVIFQRKKSESGRTPAVLYGAQVLEALGERVDDLGELVLVRLALLHGQPPPGRIDLEERVRDVLALHVAKCYRGSSGSSGGASGSALSPSRLSQPSTLSRKPWLASLASR